MIKRFNPYLLVVVLINSLIYHRWLSFSVFTYSDWAFHFKEAMVDRLIPTVWNTTWNYDFGQVDVLLWKFPIYLLTGVFGSLGYNYNVAEKVLVFWPVIYLLSIGSFLLIKHIVKSDLGALIGSFIFSFSTYFLSIDTQGHEFLTVGFALSTIAILYFIKLLDERRVSLAVVVSLLLLLVGVFDLRCLYITVGIVLLYLFYFTLLNFKSIKKKVINFLIIVSLPFIILLLVNLYWLLPILNVDYLASNTVLGRQIFGNEFYNLQNSFTTFFPFWTGGEPLWFTVLRIPIYFWVYPILAIIGLIVNKKNSKIIFFALIALIGIFFSKQADIPFPTSYVYFYENFPGFSAFRESSKFDFMVSLGYAVLIGGLVEWLVRRTWSNRAQYLKYGLLSLIILVSLWNAKPIITGEINSLFAPRTVPSDFIRLKNTIIPQPDYSRTFWINKSNYWSINNNTHPEIEGRYVINDNWSKYFNDILSNERLKEGEKMMNVLRREEMNNLLDLSSVKYVIVPLYDKETENSIIKGFGKTYSYYENEMSKIPYLTKVDGISQNILIYENADYRPHIYATKAIDTIGSDNEITKIEYQEKSPSEYKLELRGVSGRRLIYLTDAYSPSWKMRIGDFDWVNVIQDNHYFQDDTLHKQSELGFNYFIIDPSVICGDYKCKQNADGSYDLNLTLYFEPQAYFYLGMIISGSVLAICLGYLLYYGTKKIKHN